MLPDDYAENRVSTEYPPSRLAGLNPFQAGVSGNPKGRPIGSKNRSTLAKEWLEMTTDGEHNIDRVMKALILKASEGDVPAIKELLDSSFGKLTDKSQVEMQATVSKVERTIVDVKSDETA